MKPGPVPSTERAFKIRGGRGEPAGPGRLSRPRSAPPSGRAHSAAARFRAAGRAGPRDKGAERAAGKRARRGRGAGPGPPRLRSVSCAGPAARVRAFRGPGRGPRPGWRREASVGPGHVRAALVASHVPGGRAGRPGPRSPFPVWGQRGRAAAAAARGFPPRGRAGWGGWRAGRSRRAPTRPFQ